MLKYNAILNDIKDGLLKTCEDQKKLEGKVKDVEDRLCLIESALKDEKLIAKSMNNKLESNVGSISNTQDIELLISKKLEKDKRNCNILIFKYSEERDIDFLFSHFNEDGKNIKNAMKSSVRLGKKTIDRIRPLFISFEDVTSKLRFLKKLLNLRIEDKENFGSIKISPDRTLEERKAYFNSKNSREEVIDGEKSNSIDMLKQKLNKDDINEK